MDAEAEIRKVDALFAPYLDLGSRTDEWFAWRPVRTGALGTGPWRWLRRLWRNRCAGVAIYQGLAD